MEQLSDYYHIIKNATQNSVIIIIPVEAHFSTCSARDWDGKDYLRIIPRVVW
jgi:hypothetical protein